LDTRWILTTENELVSLDAFEEAILLALTGLGRILFQADTNYNQMHGRVLGAMARVAVRAGFDLAIELPHLLAEPVYGPKRKQHQARPDMTLFISGSETVWGLLEYESADINGCRLDYKRHLLINWPRKTPCETIIVIMTVPAPKRWKDSPDRSEIERHRDLLMEDAASLDTSYSFFLADPSQGIELTRFRKGVSVDRKARMWSR